ncbi:hypothetical protein DACRYDRAFT_51415 [Dacryopinax primogenitus]|uniref:Uncharacterized protein n=1 Tax=Dacryopinax primogenitus (strain DJM 731) TaxID=1858805 RepID=M5GD43_DACPD|nr:uncharacterized protein DACRYDRAFT_51415 [Dacryopinax primogenitus]EJU02128.1 hypothetical protein DACRYDRAFT_51415 [Dacryopinax primogenitus]
MSQEFEARAVLNSGATGLFIDMSYIEEYNSTTMLLECAQPVYNVNGMPNEAGVI